MHPLLQRLLPVDVTLIVFKLSSECFVNFHVRAAATTQHVSRLLGRVTTHHKDALTAMGSGSVPVSPDVARDILLVIY